MLKFLTRLVIGYVVISLIGTPFCNEMAFAESLAQSVSEGKSLAATISSGPSSTIDTSTGKITSGGKDVLTIEGAGTSQSSQTSAYGSRLGFSNLVSSEQSRLKTAPSNQGNGYRTLRAGWNNPKPSVKNDPILTNGEKANRDAFNDPIGKGCQTVVTSKPVTSTPVVSHNYKYCNRIQNLSGCKVTRDIQGYDPPVVFVSGPYPPVDCGLGCIRFNFGHVASRSLGHDDKDNPPCDVYTNANGNPGVVLKVVKPESITSATLDAFRYDDYGRLMIDGDQAYQGSTGWNPAVCDLGIVQDEHPAANLTNYFSSVAKGKLIVVDPQALVGQVGEMYGTFTIRWLPFSHVIQDPPHCYDDINNNRSALGDPAAWTRGSSVFDLASSQFWDCTDADYNRTLGNITVKPSDYSLLGPLFWDEPDVPPAPICFEAKLRQPKVVNFECYEDLQGKQQCPVSDFTGVKVQDDCDVLRNDSACSYQTSQCSPDGFDPITSTCTSWVDTYDCPDTLKIDHLENEVTTECPGDISCMGETCAGHVSESNGDFTRAAGAAEVLKNTQDEASCDAVTNTCELFKGKPLYCVKVLGGSLQDCCNVNIPKPSLIEYLHMTQKAWEAAKETQLGQWVQDAGTGAWDTITESVSNVWDSISEPVMSAWDEWVASASSNAVADTTSEVVADAVADAATQTATEGASVVSSTLKSYVVDAVKNWVTDAFPEASAMIGEFMASEAMQLVTSIISVIGWIYLIYQIVKLIVQMVYPCTKDMFELAVAKDLKKCHYVGDKRTKSAGVTTVVEQHYCCFASPFSRIVNEQARAQPQVGKSWGAAPPGEDCSGFSMDQFVQIDWDKVDLSEWIAMLQLSGQLDVDPATLKDKFNPEHVAGKEFADGTRSPPTYEILKDLFDKQTGGNDKYLDDRRNRIACQERGGC